MFNHENFMPHGHCYLWRGDILWLNVFSDALIALAYFSIPIALFYFVRRRKDLEYKWMFVLFAVFILSCGVTHLFSIFTTWMPYYGWHGLLKAITAGASVATAALLWPLIPKALRLPSPNELSEKNRQLKELTRTLEQRVAEKIKDSEKLNLQLIATNKAKDEFIANLSHELRNPLNVILGYTEMLSENEVKSAEFKSAVEVIRRNAKTQLHLIEDLLDMSRITSGKFALNVKICDIKLIIDDAIRAVEHAAQAKGIKIVRELKMNETAIVCDADRLRQVLWNLLTNAVKFSPKNSQIFLTAERDSDFIITVQDHGRGIAAKDLPHLFDRFWQPEEGEKNQGGLGLGLNIAKNLAEAHGGKITARSEGIGKGSSFEVRLPIPAIQPSEASKNESSTLPLSSMNILLVEDNEDALQLLKLVLEKAGATVITAANGAEALEVIHQNGIHFIISDINMPVMDGYAFIEQTRLYEQEKGKPNRPAIALTARDGPGEKDLARRSGYHLHLVKPVRPKSLINEIVNISKRSNFS